MNEIVFANPAFSLRTGDDVRLACQPRRYWLPFERSAGVVFFDSAFYPPFFACSSEPM